ncbi:DoxX family membrane protein [Flagellimonas olearia]|uniref:DoxX family membrane protein n=1 Tax=Flagellimonas olearia TaxID=552546 RepID=A0A6I1E2V7_9FLAO|nr:DoxX family protein [Allomuricauda olearia]KAB7530240.1 DoxX family membrane protein [Allomuricauda olearia]
MMNKVFKTDNSISPTILRYSLGIVMLPHGYHKITNISSTIEHLIQDYDLSPILALPIVIIEFFASLLLLVGFASRIMAFLIFTVMAGAIPYHWGNGFFMNWFGNQQGEGFEYHLLALGIALAIMVLGGGRYSLDAKIVQKSQKGKTIEC